MRPNTRSHRANTSEKQCQTGTSTRKKNPKQSDLIEEMAEQVEGMSLNDSNKNELSSNLKRRNDSDNGSSLVGKCAKLTSESSYNVQQPRSLSNESLDLKKREPAPLAEQFVEVTLEEILTGCIKEVPVTHDFTGYGKEETRMFEVPIELGQRDGDKIMLFSEDPQPVEVVFVVKELKHEHFKRHGANLHHTIHLTKQEALHGCVKYVPLLNKSQSKSIRLDKKTIFKQIKNRGLPYSENSTRRGDLLVYVVVDPRSDKTSPSMTKGSELLTQHSDTLDKNEILNEDSGKIDNAGSEIVTGGNKKSDNTEKQRQKVKSSPLEQKVLVTLEELLTGCVKSVQVERKSFQSGQLKKKIFVYVVQVEPGHRSGSKIIFEEEGNQDQADFLRGDLVFVIQQIPHSCFKRFVENLYCVVRIKTNTPFDRCEIVIPTLEGERERVILDNNEKGLMILPNRGLPVMTQPENRGDLVIEYYIEPI